VLVLPPQNVPFENLANHNINVANIPKEFLLILCDLNPGVNQPLLKLLNCPNTSCPVGQQQCPMDVIALQI